MVQIIDNPSASTSASASTRPSSASNSSSASACEFKCDICGKELSTPQGLGGHKRLAHGVGTSASASAGVGGDFSNAESPTQEGGGTPKIGDEEKETEVPYDRIFEVFDKGGDAMEVVRKGLADPETALESFQKYGEMEDLELTSLEEGEAEEKEVPEEREHKPPEWTQQLVDQAGKWKSEIGKLQSETDNLKESIESLKPQPIEECPACGTEIPKPKAEEAKKNLEDYLDKHRLVERVEIPKKVEKEVEVRKPIETSEFRDMMKNALNDLSKGKVEELSPGVYKTEEILKDQGFLKG